MIRRIWITNIKNILVFTLIFVIGFSFNASADDLLEVPAGTDEIEESAFEGCISAESVIIPEGVVSVGKRAFACCSMLQQAFLPMSLTDIGEDVFADCGECMLIYCPAGSEALSWAKANRFDWNADTVCRALVIGENYTGTNVALIGPTNDMHAVAFCLRKMNVNDYTVTEKSNLTAEGIKSAIETAFAGACENDISLFYYSGHGDSGGKLVGIDMVRISPQELKACFDNIPGRKILIVDACYSGALIQDDDISVQSNEDVEQEFTEAFLSAFSRKTRAAFNSDDYYVMASCRNTEEAAEDYITSGGSGKYMGFFTYALCTGCGWNGITSRECELMADANDDGVVSFEEAYGYAYQSALLRNSDQHAVVYPAECTYFSPFRK